MDAHPTRAGTRNRRACTATGLFAAIEDARLSAWRAGPLVGERAGQEAVASRLLRRPAPARERKLTEQ